MKVINPINNMTCKLNISKNMISCFQAVWNSSKRTVFTFKTIFRTKKKSWARKNWFMSIFNWGTVDWNNQFCSFTLSSSHHSCLLCCFYRGIIFKLISCISYVSKNINWISFKLCYHIKLESRKRIINIIFRCALEL